jgi:calcium-dependent protein kinase
MSSGKKHRRNARRRGRQRRIVVEDVVGLSAARERTNERGEEGNGFSSPSSSRRGREVVARGFLSDWLSKNTTTDDKKKNKDGNGNERGGGGGGSQKSVSEKKKKTTSSSQQQQQRRNGNATKPRGRSSASSSSSNNKIRKNKPPPTKERSLRTHVERAMEKARKAEYPAYGTNSDKAITKAQMKPDFGLRRDLHELYSVKDLDDEDPIGAGELRNREESYQERHG